MANLEDMFYSSATARSIIGPKQPLTVTTFADNYKDLPSGVQQDLVILAEILGGARGKPSTRGSLTRIINNQRELTPLTRKLCQTVRSRASGM